MRQQLLPTKLASSSGAEAEAVRQVSPESNTSTVVNLAEKARQRAMLRHGGGGAPTALTPQNTRPWESSTWSTSRWTNSQSPGLGFYMVLLNPCLLPFLFGKLFSKKIWRGKIDGSESAQNHIALG